MKKTILARFVLFILFIIIVFFSITIIKTKYFVCQRTSPYEKPEEFNRAINILIQMVGEDENYRSYFGDLFSRLNCLDIQYSDTLKEEGSMAYWTIKQFNTQHIYLLINSDFKSFDADTIAFALIHELTHIKNYFMEKKVDCFSDEANAFTSQVFYLSKLSQNQRNSIYSQVKANKTFDQIFQSFLPYYDWIQKDNNECSTLKKKGDLTSSQFNDCLWSKTESKLLEGLKKDPFYQNDCKR